MSNGARGDHAHGPGSPRSSGELRERRLGLRRRRRRRRAAAAVIFAAVCAVIAFGLAQAPSRRPHGGGRAVSSTGREGSGAGLSPRTLAGRVREGRAVDRVLAYTAYVRLGGHGVRQVALTFDDGPSEYTPAILRILRRTHTPATFFVIGRLARSYPRLIAAEARAGFEIGDHTQTHPFLASLPAAAQVSQITMAADAIRRAGGPYPRLFRPPYGSFDGSTLANLRQQGMLMVLWSADTKDYARPGVGRIAYTALSGAQPGAIILMHDGGGDRRQTVAALPRIIRGLRRRGYRLVTVAQLIASGPPPHGQPSPRPLSGGV
jgi:peptidoglycan-N-acetylglucosamine deacetylase